MSGKQCIFGFNAKKTNRCYMFDDNDFSSEEMFCGTDWVGLLYVHREYVEVNIRYLV